VNGVADKADRDVRVLDVGAGRTLTIRPMAEGDVEGLDALYRGLSEEDRYRRFFSAFHPRREFVESWARVGERGGYGLVAISSGDGRERLVGEAAYSPIRDGLAELAVTVADDWRGWLGLYLIDALVAVAATRGISTLEAEVLVENKPMRAVLRRRGAVTVDRPDWSVARIVIGTGAGPPVWPVADDRIRVLVEGISGRWRGEEPARDAGMAVVSCPGPFDPFARCPALNGEPCPLAADADVIVLALRPSDERVPDLVAAHRRLHPGSPMASDGDPPVDDEVVDLTACSTGAELVRRLRELAARTD
jgi:RimJ/RimL family protein N-acetyltransferase